MDHMVTRKYDTAYAQNIPIILRVLRTCLMCDGFCRLFVWCEESTRLHRLSGLPSVSDSCTIASIADATAANLTALAQHSLGQLDHVASQGFTLGPSNRIPNIAPLSSFGPKTHIPLFEKRSSTDDYENYTRLEK